MADQGRDVAVKAKPGVRRCVKLPDDMFRRPHIGVVGILLDVIGQEHRIVVRPHRFAPVKGIGPNSRHPDQEPQHIDGCEPVTVPEAGPLGGIDGQVAPDHEEVLDDDRHGDPDPGRDGNGRPFVPPGGRSLVLHLLVDGLFQITAPFGGILLRPFIKRMLLLPFPVVSS